jgi:hypothetical protein
LISRLIGRGSRAGSLRPSRIMAWIFLLRPLLLLGHVEILARMRWRQSDRLPCDGGCRLAAFSEAAHPVKPGPSAGFPRSSSSPNAREVPLSLLYALSHDEGLPRRRRGGSEERQRQLSDGLTSGHKLRRAHRSIGHAPRIRCGRPYAAVASR